MAGATALAALALCGADKAPTPAEAAGSALTPAQKAAVEQVVHDYLAAHPETVLQAIKTLQAREQAERLAAGKKAIAEETASLKHDPNSFAGGNQSGDVTLVEFFDYNCPYCRSVAPTVQALLADDKRLRVVIKEWPIKGPDSVAAARVSLAAGKQPKFLAFHFALLSAEGHVDEARALDVARKAGLDMDRLKKDMASSNADEVLRNNETLANKIGIDGTPAFVVGDTVVPGAANENVFKSLIADTRKSCKTKSC